MRSTGAAIAASGPASNKAAVRQVAGLFLFALAWSMTAAGETGHEAVEGCDAPRLGSGTHVLTFAGLQRSYRLELPANHNRDKPVPLIVLFHGWGGDENEFLAFDSVRELADKAGYAVVAPRGLGSGPPDQHFNSWTFRGSDTGLDGEGGPVCDSSMTNDYSYASCNDIKANSCSWTQCQQDDVAFTLALLDELESSLCLDPDRVFAVGGSNGGMFTWELAQNPASAPRLRAMASIIGLPHRAYLQRPGREDALPALLITGMQDDTVPPGPWMDSSFTTTSNGSDRFYYTGATAISRVWSDAHGCSTQQAPRSVNVGVAAVDCRSYCTVGDRWPPVMDCRGDFGHDYELGWSWPLVLSFFSQQGDR